jgi:hypothetical protein
LESRGEGVRRGLGLGWVGLKGKGRRKGQREGDEEEAKRRGKEGMEEEEEQGQRQQQQGKKLREAEEMTGLASEKARW